MKYLNGWRKLVINTTTWGKGIPGRGNREQTSPNGVYVLCVLWEEQGGQMSGVEWEVGEM